jgi:hypothetical protein
MPDDDERKPPAPQKIPAAPISRVTWPISQDGALKNVPKRRGYQGPEWRVKPNPKPRGR